MQFNLDFVKACMIMILILICRQPQCLDSVCHDDICLMIVNYVIGFYDTLYKNLNNALK